MKVDFTHTTSRVQSPKLLSIWQVHSLSQDQTTKTTVFVCKGYFKCTFILDHSHLSASLTSGLTLVLPVYPTRVIFQYLVRVTIRNSSHFCSSSYQQRLNICAQWKPSKVSTTFQHYWLEKLLNRSEDLVRQTIEEVSTSCRPKMAI